MISAIMLAKMEQFFNEWINRARDFVPISSLDSAKLRAAVVILAITILSYQGVSFFYKIVGFMAMGKSAAAGAIHAPRPAGEAAREPLERYAVIIAERNLFQTTTRETGAGNGVFAAGEEIAEFDLKGTIAGSDSFGYIIIEERGSKKQRLYRLGAMIGSSKLVSISRNTATINRGGRDVVVRIKQTPEEPLLSSPRAAREGISRPQIAVSRREMTERLQDLQSIMTHAQVRPYFEGGAQQGFIISNIKPDSLYQKLGLQNGDIIIDVNNKRMQSADDVLQLVSLMQSGQEIALNLKRQGREETIKYSFH